MLSLAIAYRALAAAGRLLVVPEDHELEEAIAATGSSGPSD